MSRVGDALALYGVTLLALVLVAPQLSTRFGLAGVVASELLLVLLPTLLWLRTRRVPAHELGLFRARPRALVGGALIGAGACWLMALMVSWLVDVVVRASPAEKQALERLLVPVNGQRPLWIDIAALALVPALAEELLFRGVLFGTFERRVGAVAAVALTALAFALYHASAPRFLPAAIAGVVLGVVRARSRSLWAAIACHTANNVTVLMLARAGRAMPSLRWVPLVGALLAVTLGFSLTVRPPLQRS